MSEKGNETLFGIGRLCIKIAGRDSNRRCVVVEILDDKYVIVDGETRRKKVNVVHLEPLDKVFKIASKAGHDEISKLFKKEFDTDLKQSKPKKPAQRPKKQKAKRSDVSGSKPTKKTAAKADVKSPAKSDSKPEKNPVSSETKKPEASKK